MKYTHLPFQILIRSFLLALLSMSMLLPITGLARNGDDWVLVQRFQNQQKSAESGSPAAMYELAHMYELGRGTPPDMHKAVQWYEKAVSKGQNDARARLGLLYLEGRGIKADLNKAGSLLKSAAEQGNATGQFYLGKMYEDGKGMRRDLGQAKYWYRQAEKNGYYLAIARLKVLQKQPSGNNHKSKTKHTQASASSSQADSPASILKQTVLSASWQHNGRPLGFLPSSNTKCGKLSTHPVKCKSGKQKRNIGDAIITYITDATVGGFNNSDEFSISYTNTVLKVKAVDRPSLDGEALPAHRKPNIPLGKQSLVHKLHCELKTINKLVCIKDNNRTDVYTRAAR